MLPRGRHDISRLEAFSDAAFAFALTLLLVSLNVPRSYGELVVLLQGFLSFACCFAVLVWIWHEHNQFFRRYGLQDGLTVFLNGLLLFFALFFVYPLKFMFDSMFEEFMPGAYPGLTRMTLPELSRASAIYGLGFVILFLMFALLHARAWAKRDALGLTVLERFDLKLQAGSHLVSAGVGVLVFLFAALAPVRFAMLSPMLFGLLGPAHWLYAARMERRRTALAARIAAPEPVEA